MGKLGTGALIHRIHLYSGKDSADGIYVLTKPRDLGEQYNRLSVFWRLTSTVLCVMLL